RRRAGDRSAPSIQVCRPSDVQSKCPLFTASDPRVRSRLGPPVLVVSVLSACGRIGYEIVPEQGPLTASDGGSGGLGVGGAGPTDGAPTSTGTSAPGGSANGGAGTGGQGGTSGSGGDPSSNDAGSDAADATCTPESDTALCARLSTNC